MWAPSSHSFFTLKRNFAIAGLTFTAPTVWNSAVTLTPLTIFSEAVRGFLRLLFLDGMALVYLLIARNFLSIQGQRFSVCLSRQRHYGAGFSFILVCASAFFAHGTVAV